MSSPSEHFQCRWQASRSLLTVYLAVQALAWLALWQLDIPQWARLSGLLLCLLHALHSLPQRILFNCPGAWRSLRHEPGGWQVWNARDGWQSVRVRADSLALPWLVVLRFHRVEGSCAGWRVCSVCIPRDALTPDVHRRLRVLLRFARGQAV